MMAHISETEAAVKVLLVEDNAIDLKLEHSILQRAGYEVLDAKSAEQALQILKIEKPQVILSDLKLPQMDGLTFMHRLKQNAATASIPIIAVTAYPDHFSKRAASEAGVAAYLVKPINTRTLSQQVAAVASHS